MYLRLDRKRKMPATILLKALGYSTEELLRLYYDIETFELDEEKVFRVVNKDLLLNQKASMNIVDPATNEVIVKEKRKLNRASIRKIIAAGITKI